MNFYKELHPNRPFFYFLAISIIILLGVYYYSQLFVIELDEIPQTEIQSQITDETADWKTYRNEEYGFEFKYPTEWVVRDNSSVSTDLLYLTLTTSMGGSSSIKITNIPFNSTIPQVLSGITLPLNLTKLELAGKPALRYDTAHDGCGSENLEIDLWQKVLSISVAGCDGDNPISLDNDDVQKIISTFNFFTPSQ